MALCRRKGFIISTIDTSELVQKLAFTFEKVGVSRFFSHHDLMRHFERALRRAALRPRLSSGFNPRPRMVFPHAMPLGIESACEEIEIEFCEVQPDEEVMRRLRTAVKPVVNITLCRRLPLTSKSRTVSSSEYEITGWVSIPVMAVAVGKMLDEKEIFTTRGGPGKERQVEIRQYISEAVLTGKGLKLKLAHTPQGAGRADEVCRWLCGETEDELSRLKMVRINMEFA